MPWNSQLRMLCGRRGEGTSSESDLVIVELWSLFDITSLCAHPTSAKQAKTLLTRKWTWTWWGARLPMASACRLSSENAGVPEHKSRGAKKSRAAMGNARISSKRPFICTRREDQRHQHGPIGREVLEGHEDGRREDVERKAAPTLSRAPKRPPHHACARATVRPLLVGAHMEVLRVCAQGLGDAGADANGLRQRWHGAATEWVAMIVYCPHRAAAASMSVWWSASPWRCLGRSRGQRLDQPRGRHCACVGRGASSELRIASWLASETADGPAAQPRVATIGRQPHTSAAPQQRGMRGTKRRFGGQP